MTILDGRFALVEAAGRGASGEVHRALDGKTGRVVAVKILRDKVSDEASRARFARETRILASVQNPHVVGYVAHGHHPNGCPYVATEWLEGEDLAHRQRRRPLGGREIVDVLEQIADGLAELHAIGVVHRDLKPSNLFLTERDDGRLHVTVIDLGIASVASDPGLTAQGTLLGTPSYMPPEQILGVGLTARSDVFSLGVVLFELVTGEKPFSGNDVVTLIAKIALQDAPRVRDFVPTAPRELDAIVARAMAKDPADRFASVTAFVEALASSPPFESARDLALRDAGESYGALRVRDVESTTLSTEERRVVTAVLLRSHDGALGEADAAVFDRVTAEHGGAPHALLGLARVAIVGGARSVGDEVQRAARAALALRREKPAMEIAIATGRGPTGRSALSGDAIERAARPGARLTGIRLDEATARLLGDGCPISRAGADLGLHEPSAPAAAGGASSDEATPAGALRARDAAPAGATAELDGFVLLGRAPAFVGRARELAELEALFDEVDREGVARAAIVVGPPGSGKSRLRYELERRLSERADRPLVLRGRASAIADGASFALAGALLRAHAGVRDGDPRERQLERLGRGLSEAERAALVPHLARIANVGAAPGPLEDSRMVGDRLRVAFEGWLRALTARRAVVLVLEDVQWADIASIALVEAALRNLPEARLLAIAIARPDVEKRFPKLWESRSPQTLRVPPLTRRASLALVREAAGSALPDERLERIVERAEGNAFYLEELLRAALRAPDAPTPDTVLGMVQARLDALGPEGKRVLKAASVYGETVWAGAIAEVLGDRPSDAAAAESLDATLTALVSAEILERRAEAAFSGEMELAFRSTLVREAAYELLPEGDRVRAHLRAADWLERHGESESFTLARHFELGGASARALPWYVRAAEQALFGGDFALVTACAEKAIAAGASRDTLGHVQLLVAEAERWRGDMRSALVAAGSAAKLLPRGSSAWFSALRELIGANGRLGNTAAIAPIATLASEATAAAEATSAQVAALVPAAVHFLYAGDTASAESLAARVEALLAGAPEIEPRDRARVHQLRAVLASHHDALEEGIAEQLAALEQFDLGNDRRAATLVRSNLAFVLLELGDIDRAIAILEQALADATHMNLGTIRPLVLQNLGTALARRGHHDAAFAMHTEAATTFRALGDPRLEGASRMHLALLHLERGELDDAERAARAVVELRIASIEVGARAIVARVHLARGDADQARAEATRAIEVLNRAKNVEELEIYARLAFAEALAAAGDARASREALHYAKHRIDERLAKLKDPALRTSLVERIPEHARVIELLGAA
ncbi:MAG: protein kinase [Polyangiaceae bacterium]